MRLSTTWAWWHMSIIPAHWEAGGRRITSWGPATLLLSVTLSQEFRRQQETVNTTVHLHICTECYPVCMSVTETSRSPDETAKHAAQGIHWQLLMWGLEAVPCSRVLRCNQWLAVWPWRSHLISLWHWFPQRRAHSFYLTRLPWKLHEITPGLIRKRVKTHFWSVISTCVLQSRRKKICWEYIYLVFSRP